MLRSLALRRWTALEARAHNCTEVCYHWDAFVAPFRTIVYAIGGGDNVRERDSTRKLDKRKISSNSINWWTIWIPPVSCHKVDCSNIVYHSLKLRHLYCFLRKMKKSFFDEKMESYETWNFYGSLPLLNTVRIQHLTIVHVSRPT